MDRQYFIFQLSRNVITHHPFSPSRLAGKLFMHKFSRRANFAFLSHYPRTKNLLRDAQPPHPSRRHPSDYRDQRMSRGKCGWVDGLAGDEGEG